MTYLEAIRLLFIMTGLCLAPIGVFLILLQLEYTG